MHLMKQLFFALFIIFAPASQASTKFRQTKTATFTNNSKETKLFWRLKIEKNPTSNGYITKYEDKGYLAPYETMEREAHQLIIPAPTTKDDLKQFYLEALGQQIPQFLKCIKVFTYYENKENESI